MMFENKIKELKIELPNAADPVGSYVAAKQVEKLLKPLLLRRLEI